MAEEKSREAKEASEDVNLEAAIPMKKTNPAVVISIVAGIVVAGGAILWSSSGGEPAPQAREEPKAKGDDAPQLSAKEAQEHLLKTQKALAAAEEEVAKAAAAAQAEEAARAAEEAPAPAEAPAQKTASKFGASSAADTQPKAKAPSQDSKKKIESLDSLGADITSALK